VIGRNPARRGRQRAWSLAALVCFVAAQLLATAHDVRAQHVRCAEHGELVELHPAGHARAATAPATPATAAHVTPADAGDHDHGRHAHCAFAPLTHGSAAPLVAAAPAVPASPPPAVPIAPPAGRHARAVIAPLVLAPKTSPPR
jgi:hypothetical protein